MRDDNEDDGGDAEEDGDEEEEEEKYEENGRGVGGIGENNGGRGDRGVGPATPYAVSRTGRRCTSKRQWSQLG